MDGKEIIFRINELSNKSNQGWIPYAKPIKMFILDYISKENSRPNATATLTNEMFSILCDLEHYYKKAGKLGSDGFSIKYQDNSMRNGNYIRYSK